MEKLFSLWEKKPNNNPHHLSHVAAYKTLDQVGDLETHGMPSLTSRRSQPRFLKNWNAGLHLVGGPREALSGAMRRQNNRLAWEPQNKYVLSTNYMPLL